MTEASIRVEILPLNAYGARYHVMVNGRIVFSAMTVRHCRDWMRRHGYTLERGF